MRIETFVKKAMGKVAADTFLAEHRQFLCGFKSIRPVLAMLEQKRILPTPALHQILQLIMTEQDPSEKTEEVVNTTTGEVTTKTLVAVEKAAKKREPKRYQMILFVKGAGGSENPSDETYDAADYGMAMRDAYRILFRNEDSIYMDITGDRVTTRIMRDEAMGHILGTGPGGKTATKKTAKTSSGLGWRVSAKGYTAKFSRG